MSLRKNKIVRYNNKDPRYNLMIEDSDEYNMPIHPFQLEETCDNERFRIYNPYRAIGCGGHRYENCDETVDDREFDTCNLELRDPTEIKTRRIRLSDYAKLNNNSFYPDTRISKILNPNVEINNSPDTSKKEYFSFGDINTDDKISDSEIILILAICLCLACLCLSSCACIIAQ